jgi:hypothetical protein
MDSLSPGCGSNDLLLTHNDAMNQRDRAVIAVCLLIASAFAIVASESADNAGGIILADEAIGFDADLRPQFSAHQLKASAEATRAGLVRWAATGEGKSIIARFQAKDRQVIVVESDDESTIGRAPQPGFVTLLAAGDPKQLKTYWLIVNPALAAQYDRPKSIPLGLPQTPADVMALAWAGEMLHIEFYAAGIPLPHHERLDFQKRWLRVADALGTARAQHGTDELHGGAR